MKMQVCTIAIVVSSLVAAQLYAQKAEQPIPDNAALTSALARAESIRSQGEANGWADPEKWKERKRHEYLWVTPEARQATIILAQRWDDPRSERALEQLSKTGPLFEREGICTIAYWATEKLYELRARRQYEEWMKDKTPEEQVKKIREVLSEHEDWLNRHTRPKEKDQLVTMLVARAHEISGEQAVDLICQTGLSGSWNRRYAKAIIAYAKRIGREKTLKTPDLIDRINYTGDAEAVPILKQWIRDEKGDAESVELVKALHGLPHAEPVLRELRSDPRPGVAKWAKILTGN